MRTQRSRWPPILWNVVQEHLDEASFFWRQRERTLRAPDHGLADLADGDERRLWAHLEGLRVGGPVVAERLLLPALEEGEGWERTAAAHVLLAADAARWGPRVLSCLEETPPQERAFLQQALSLSAAAEVDDLLLTALPGAAPGLQAALLEVLRLRRTDVTSVLGRLSLAESPELLTAAIRAARHAPEAVVAPLVSRGLDTEDARCQDAAIEVGLVRGHFAAAARCRTLISEGKAGRAVLAFLAMSGDRRGVMHLLARMADEGARAEVLWALGLSGRSEALEAVLRLILSDADPLAAEAFRFVTGIPLDSYLEPPEDEDEAEASPAPDAEGVVSFLPEPTAPQGQVRADVIDRWWSEEQSRFPSGGRYVWGRRWTPEVALQALLEVPVTRRPALAWELAVRSGGACWVETGTWTWIQARQIREARRLRLDPGTRAFEVVLVSR
ncbi:hypothetical protein ACN28E_54710 [Archangium lansingense]|uniref:hypothetical protein n=1 Tax=Archangium lansingense TaxID=2995310 RepID=UPI003B805B6B